MTEGTARVEKNIREYTGDDPSGTKRRGERKMEGGGENTHTKMSSSNPDLRRQGNRQWANFEPSPCGRKPRNFCSNFHRARFSRMARDKKDVSGSWPRRRLLQLSSTPGEKEEEEETRKS